MNGLRKIHTPPRLAKLMAEKGGMHVSEALKRADAALEALREPSLLTIDDLIARMEALLAHSGDQGLQTAALYRLSAGVIDMSGAESTRAVWVAAHSLCELIDEAGVDEAGVGDAGAAPPAILAAVRVHVASIKLLHRAAPDPAVQTPILRGLARVLAKHRAEPSVDG